MVCGMEILVTIYSTLCTKYSTMCTIYSSILCTCEQPADTILYHNRCKTGMLVQRLVDISSLVAPCNQPKYVSTTRLGSTCSLHNS